MIQSVEGAEETTDVLLVERDADVHILRHER